MNTLNTDEYKIPNPYITQKKSFLHFPNIPDKPALVFVTEKNAWEECKTVKSTQKDYVSVKLQDGSIYNVPKIRKDILIPLLDYGDIVKVCKHCRYRRKAYWNWTGTCQRVANNMYSSFYTKIGEIDYVRGECEYREPLTWYQELIDSRIGKPKNKDILHWKKWDKYL